MNEIQNVQDLHDDAEHDFLQELAHTEGGKKVDKAKPSFSSVLEEERVKLIETAMLEIDYVSNGAGTPNKYGMPVTKWTEKQTDGRYKISFKARGVTLELTPGKTYFYKRDADETCEFIAKFILHAKLGRIDKYIDKAKAAKVAKAQGKKVPSRAAEYIEAVSRARNKQVAEAYADSVA